MIKEIDFRKTVDLSFKGFSLLIEPEEVPDQRINRVLIPQEYIEKRVRALAEKICSDYSHIQSITVVVVLKGAVVFASDLVREIYRLGGPDIKIEFFKVNGYGNEMKSKGEVERNIKIELEPNNLQGRDVLIVEDLVDQGFTLSALETYIVNKSNARSLKICVLLDKKLNNPSDSIVKIRNKLQCDYTGFKIYDKWVAGYGMDSVEDLRNLPFIVEINEDYYM